MPKIDLNLLRVFETLYETRSVTRAAERLGLTQSAVSHALGRLRDTIGDPLFLRHPGGLQPTARAIGIEPGIRQGLEQLRDALSLSRFDPATAVRRFRISTGAYFSALLIPELIARSRAEAPNVSLEVNAPGPDLLPSLDNGTIDITLGAFGKVPARLTRQALFNEELVWIAGADSEVARDTSLLASLPANRRLSVATGRPFPGHGAYSWENGLERLVVAAIPSDISEDGDEADGPGTVHDALIAIATVAVTDLVALVPRRLAMGSPMAERIAIIEAGSPASEIEMAMLWHRRLADDPALHWLRMLILSCLGLDENAD